MNDTEKTPGKFRQAMRLIKTSLVSVHRLIWGSGWKWFFIAVVITVVILTALMFISMELTSQPKFCNVCHNMKPYYASWVNSSHKHVTCTDCHFPPGLKNKIRGKFTAFSMLVNYFTGIYKRNKPWAEIPDESCMRSGCHETRLLQGKVKFKENITFDHEPHLKELRRGKKLRCTSCHSQIVQGDHISVTPSTCFLCHFKGLEGHSAEETHDVVNETGKPGADLMRCDTCHTPPVSKSDDKEPVSYDHKNVLEKKMACMQCHGNMIVGDGFVPKNRCDTCHGEVDKIKQYSNTSLIHKKHITDHKIECSQCHLDIQHKSISQTQMVKANCQVCHRVQVSVYSGDVVFSSGKVPNVMWQKVECIGCHKDETGKLVRPGKTACSACHEVDYEQMYDDWVKSAQEQVEKLREKVKRDKLKPGDRAYDILLFLEKDGSKGIHNPELYEKLVEEGMK